jgi:hypothetical protein
LSVAYRVSNAYADTSAGNATASSSDNDAGSFATAELGTVTWSAQTPRDDTTRTLSFVDTPATPLPTAVTAPTADDPATPTAVRNSDNPRTARTSSPVTWPAAIFTATSPDDGAAAAAAGADFSTADGAPY